MCRLDFPFKYNTHTGRGVLLSARDRSDPRPRALYSLYLSSTHTPSRMQIPSTTTPLYVSFEMIVCCSAASWLAHFSAAAYFFASAEPLCNRSSCPI